MSARFNRTVNLLDVRKTGTGRGTVSSRPSGISCGDDCTEYFPIGATVTLSAAPSPDSKFAGWGGACSGTGTCTVSMGSSQLVTADFVYAPYWLEVGKLGDGNGRVVSTPSGIDCGADCTENYAGGRLVALEATPAPGSEFVGWNWGTCPGTGSCVVIMNELRIRVSAIFRRVSYSLSVTKSGSGSGLVSSSPSGISCGSDCSEWYAIDSAVSLSATASSGSIFTGWGGACSGTGLCTVTMDASKNVTANFSPALTRLTVSKSGTGTGTVSSNPGGINCGSDCSQYYANGTRVTLNASASSGSYFVGWGGACSGTGTCTVTMDASKNVTAKFSPVQRRLLVSKSGTGTGTVSSNPGGIYCGSDCWQYYANGTRVTLNASASSGSYFAGWSGACSGTGTCTVTMNGAKNVTASFLPFYRLLSVSKSGNGSGTVSSNPGGIYCGSDCWQYYASGTTVALNARPSSGSYFTGWTGACSGTGSCNVTMNGSKSVTAVFKLLSYRLTVTKLGEGGAGAGYVGSNPAGISCGSDCIQWYWNGTSVTLTVTGSRPYRFVGWGGACSGATGPTCTVSMTSSKSVTVAFRYDP